MKKTTWIVQENLHPTGAIDTLHRLERACAEADRPLVRVRVTPSSTEMPIIPEVSAPFVFYGYTTLITNATQSPRWRSGVFFDPALFHPSRYAERYGDLSLNPDTRIVPQEQLRAEIHASDTRFFLRPNDDWKQWTGQVMTFGEYCAWFDGQDESIHRAEIVVSSPKNIAAEWRVVLVDGQPVASSQYRPTALSWVPAEVEQFARVAAAKWSPVAVFVMDIARVEGGLKIIELNCFNGSGFYLADVGRIVKNVSAYIESTMPNPVIPGVAG